MSEEVLICKQMAKVLADLPAIGKEGKAPANMGGYAFRGVEDVLNALNPILSKHEVFFLPEVLERLEAVRSTKGGGTMNVVNLRVRYRFYATDGSNVEAVTWGEGTDSGDKATQKALTAAMKYMLFEVFCINTKDQADDDAERHDVPPTEFAGSPKELRRQAWGTKELPEWPTWDEMDDAMESFQAEVRGLSVETKDAVTAYMKEKNMGWPLTPSSLAKAREFIKEQKAPASQPESSRDVEADFAEA